MGQGSALSYMGDMFAQWGQTCSFAKGQGGRNMAHLWPLGTGGGPEPPDLLNNNAQTSNQDLS